MVGTWHSTFIWLKVINFNKRRLSKRQSSKKNLHHSLVSLKKTMIIMRPNLCVSFNITELSPALFHFIYNSEIYHAPPQWKNQFHWPLCSPLLLCICFHSMPHVLPQLQNQYMKLLLIV